MTPLAELVQQGSAHAWLFIPSAILLGALHGLEPGHSKTMMAAFIIAVRGTVRQAVLLGLCATLSHTLIVWVIALGGLYLWRGVASETIEPYLQLVSAVVIVGMAVWMISRTRREQRFAAAGLHHNHDHHHHHHDHDHHHHDHHRHHGHGDHHHHDHGDDHHHGSDEHRIDTGHGVLALSIFEDGAPPRFHLKALAGHGPTAAETVLEIERPSGAREVFTLRKSGHVLQSVEEVAEPHDFIARVRITHGDHAHSYDVAFVEHGHAADHDHIHEELRGLDLTAGGYQDAHELAHANDIRRRFADRNVTTGQIAIFGLTGGLIPCPGAITVLILCLQLQRIVLGATLVASFSVGLAMTMVAAGVAAAVSVKHVSSRRSGFDTLVRRAPYLSGVVILGMGVYLGVQGWLALAPHA